MPRCRACSTELLHTVVDLGSTPLANRYLTEEQLGLPEPHFPLHARVCGTCFLVQVDAVVNPDTMFSQYAYFSSTSAAWLAHSKQYADEATKRFGLGQGSRVLEIASNDGYLLRQFLNLGLSVRGVEPAANIAAHAVASGIPTDVRFFGMETALTLRGEGYSPDLVVGNNVLAHVPDLNDFVGGLATILSPGSALTMEFPHLLRLLEQTQFDTIYHEHYSYLSLSVVETLFDQHGLRLFDVEEIPTHGGSLRIFASLRNDLSRPSTPALEHVRELERVGGLRDLGTYDGFAARVRQVQTSLLDFLREARAKGRTVVAYGAAAKGNTLLNSSGISEPLIEYVVDKSPHKQGLFMPGSHLAIKPPEAVFSTRPDYLLVLPWNWADEICGEMAGIRQWLGKFVIPIPTLRVSE